MARWLICEGTTVVNVVGGDTEPPAGEGQYVILDPTNVVNVGAVADPKDAHYDKLDKAILTCLFQIAKGTVPGGINNSSLTVAQFKNYIKGLMS
jgi:hypothetical protein